MEKKYFIGIASHKEYRMPESDYYIPVQVGAAGKDLIANYLPDNQGDNISHLNPNFCELTATYSIWKNIEADYKGLVHYRRHFSDKDCFNEFNQGTFANVLSDVELDRLLLEENFDAILPKKRKYYIETLYSHYDHTHNVADLDETRAVIEDLYPNYLGSFDQVMQRTSAHMFNMYIMKAEYFDRYAEWLFDILFELEKRLDISAYDVQEARVFGYISELLLDVWLEVNPIKYVEKPVMFMESQNWLIKGSKFIYNKFARRNFESE